MRRRASRRRRWLRGLLWIGLGGTLAVAAFALHLDHRVRAEFEGRRFALPARVFARPLELYPGLRLGENALRSELTRLGYVEGLRGDEPGHYVRTGATLALVTRPFTFWDGPQPARPLRVTFDDGRVSELVDFAGHAVKLARLDPVWIGGIYPAHNEDRILVRLPDVPPQLVQALLAVEDRSFRSHVGIDPRGIARALVATVTGKGVQGGSTITQQLVKNFFLTSERTLQRKFTEVIMALLLELHYDKDDILETYLNEIYLGQDRNRAIHGVGLAAQFYFGKPLDRLDLAECALLVALVRGPAFYDPHRHPQRALERRNRVLAEMMRLGQLDPKIYAASRAAGLGVRAKPGTGTSPHPAFLELVRRQLRRDYRDEDLKSEGLQIYTTLDPQVQAAAELGLRERLMRLERARRATDATLEGAAVVTNSQTGEVQALVGGVDPLFQGFNRALDAARPIGSLIKPAIYLTALARPQRYTLITPLDDSPLVWKSRGAKDWQPENFDKTNHGAVPLRLALARSYNVASARLGLELGVEDVHATALRLGVTREFPAYASSLLGAIELTPLEVAQMYQTIAANGFRTPLRAIREVLTAEGRPLKRYGLSVEQAFDAAPVYLLTTALQDVVREGTAQGLRQWIRPEMVVAGKTGTTDELRDSWFAGFTADRVAVVWVGYDDNRPARLTGASGAMMAWGDIMARLPNDPLAPPVPDNVEQRWIDPASGLLADKDCAGAIEVPFIAGSAPQESAPCARNPIKRLGNWFRRLFE
jgi:penicillin-binding protein 1B